MKSEEEIRLEKENKQLRQEIAWFHALMRNGTIPPPVKVSFYEAKYEYIHSERDENGYTRIFVWKIAEETGIGRNAVGRSLQTLADYGVIDRKVEYVEGRAEKAIFIKFNDVARYPGSIEFPESTRGGKRFDWTCRNCGHTEYVEHIKRECTCTKCGLSEVENKWRTVQSSSEEGEDNSES